MTNKQKAWLHGSQTFNLTSSLLKSELVVHNRKDQAASS